MPVHGVDSRLLRHTASSRLWDQSEKRAVVAQQLKARKGWKPSDNAADKLFGKQGFLQEPEMDAGRYNAKEHRREVRQMSMLDVSPASESDGDPRL